MTTAAVLQAVLQFGPTILPLIQQLTSWIKEGKKDVTEDDILLLISYASKKPQDYGLPAPQPPSEA